MGLMTLQGCPPRGSLSLRERLLPLIDRKVTVFTPGFPRLTKTTGELRQVCPDSFVVGTTRVFFNTSFYIVLHSIARSTRPFNVQATAEDMGTIRGKLIRTGCDFVEFVQVPGRDVPTLFPLNMFTSVSCEREHEE
jgi:hypothetical protein